MSELLEIKNLSVSFGNKKILNDISLTVKVGELTGILGINGSGKTTLLNAVDGLVDFSGEIFCNGQNLARTHEEERAKLISYIQQRTLLKDGVSAIEFVLYGLNPFLKFYEFPNAEQKEKAKEILIKLGLKEKIYSDFSTLSEGQKQLVVLGRSIIQNAPLMLMDEPDSSLDYNNKHLLYSTVKSTIKEYNVGGLISIHNPTFALKYCDKIFLLSNGKIAGEIDKTKADRVKCEELLRLIYKNVELVEHNGEFLVGVKNEN